MNLNIAKHGRAVAVVMAFAAQVYLQHLAKGGVRVARPAPSVNGDLV
jgi:antitoxin (DNA-binding transcriptional repressor) of toxin-antitoxin stability system